MDWSGADVTSSGAVTVAEKFEVSRIIQNITRETCIRTYFEL